MNAWAKKSLGQHWLFDESSLLNVVDAAELSTQDTVLEVGPGLGTLTEKLVDRAGQVIAVEFDKHLADELPNRVKADNLRIVQQDILSFDLTALPPDYKVVANIPYYLTSNLLRVLLESSNPPKIMSLLVQKEVAERIAAKPGQMSVLAVSVQFYCDVELRELVPATLFTPPPKVDSQIIQLKRRDELLYPNLDIKQYFRVVKAGFSGRRKTLRNSLSAGLRLDKVKVEETCSRAGVDPNDRAQTLSLDKWFNLTSEFFGN